VTTAAFADLGSVMRTAPLRFWTVEHPTGMIAAVVLVHVGRVKARHGINGEVKHQRALTFTAI
jgi:hypothetical protein